VAGGAFAQGPRKKLTDVACHWAGGGIDTRADDLAAFGLEAPAELTPQELEIWPENLEAAEVFFACKTQWEYAPASGLRLGLRYTALAAAMDMLGVADRHDVFGAVRIMESAALAVFTEREQKRQRP